MVFLCTNYFATLAWFPIFAWSGALSCLVWSFNIPGAALLFDRFITLENQIVIAS